MIIAVTGVKRSGKNTVCEILQERRGFAVIGFADELKAMAYDINPVIGWDGDGFMYLAEQVDEYGWEYVKDWFPEARRFLQRLGTEGVRNHFGQYTWTQKWWEKAEEVLLEGGDVAVPDLRFLSEFRALHDYRPVGVSIWRVHRPDLPVSGDGHDSETEQAAILHDMTILNNCSLDQLKERVLRAHAEVS
jgi:hypothetical protein